MSTYRRDFNETKYISFLTKYDESLEKYNKILGKVRNSIKKEFDSEPSVSFLLTHILLTSV